MLPVSCHYYVCENFCDYILLRFLLNTRFLTATRINILIRLTKLIYEESSHKTSNKITLPAVISTYYLGQKTRMKYQGLPSRRQ